MPVSNFVNFQEFNSSPNNEICPQGGYTANLAPGKLVGKLLNFFDSTAHRVVGGLPPPAPSASQGTGQSNEHDYQPMGNRVSGSQSTMAMSSLIPSASMEPISEWAADGNRMTVPNRSVSEPDFGRTPRQVGNCYKVENLVFTCNCLMCWPIILYNVFMRSALALGSIRLIRQWKQPHLVQKAKHQAQVGHLAFLVLDLAQGFCRRQWGWS